MVEYAALRQIRNFKMPNSRKGSKKHRGAWLEPEVIERLRSIATAFDTDFSGLLEKIGKGEIEVVSSTKKGNANNEEVR